jgi:PRTRC genetic system protein A
VKPVGYLIYGKTGLAGESGAFYDYILGSNGLFIRAENRHIKALVCVAPAEVRGLLPVDERVELLHGKIPRILYDLSLSVLMVEVLRERYLAVVWNGGYHIGYPRQTGEGAGVKYDCLPDTVLDIHSHGGMGAFFSSTDDSDEQGLGLSLVMGKLGTPEPEYLLRLGVYGYYADIDFEEVFK